MEIALCDDDGRFRAHTARSLEDIFENRGVKATISKFNSAEKVLEALEKGAEFDIYLLDIVMPGMDGVALARRVRERFPKTPILFFTTSRDYAIEAFALGAAHYVVKPFASAAFENAVDRALAMVPQRVAKGIVLKTSGGLVSVAIRDLVYSETDEHYQIVRLTDGREYVTRMSGLELWRILSGTQMFVRAGLKFVINLHHVLSVGKDGVRMVGGTMIEVPRRAMPELKAAFLGFCCR